MLRRTVKRITREIGVWRGVYADPRTPRPAKALLFLALAYLANPVDLIPDWIPVFGVLDDILIVPLLVWVAARIVPARVVDEHRQRLGTGIVRGKD